MTQQYNLYSSQDHATWSTLFTRQVGHIRDKASNVFLEGLERINFDSNKIPDFESLNTRLNELTGWQVKAVEGVVPYEEFFGCFANKTFPSTTWIRRLDQLDYIEEPHIFHDVFGHVPLLTNTLYCTFLEKLGTIALEHLDDSFAQTLISRLYWFSAEFGLIRETGQNKIYGAGILSSIGETTHASSDAPQRMSFNLEEIISTEYVIDSYQTKYFVLNAMEDLYEHVESIENILEGHPA